MKKSDSLLSRFSVRMGLETKAERVWFWITFSLFLIYAEAVAVAHDIGLGTFSVPRCLIGAVCTFLFCAGGVLLFRRALLTPRSEVPARKKLIAVFLGSSLLYFAYYSLWHLVYWPGLLVPDNVGQLEQVITGAYTDWHPVLQTWLFITLPYKLFNSFAAVITAQHLWLSLALGYLTYVLYRNHCPKWFIALGLVYILINPCSITLFTMPIKDTALSIVSLVLFTQLIQIYAADGQWLKKWYNLAAFALFAFLSNEMRHNAVLLVAPVFVVLLVFLKNCRRQTAVAAAAALLASILLHGPVFSLTNVQTTTTPVELLGFPMTILCDVYKYDRDALSEDTLEFMDSLAAPEDWEMYGGGSFNDIKWADGVTAKINAAGIGPILRYAADAALHSPARAAAAIGSLTSTVWQYRGLNGFGFDALFTENDLGLERTHIFPLEDEFEAARRVLRYSPTRYLFAYDGGVILLMMCAAVSCIGGGGLRRAFLVLAPLAYDFGTMFLLSTQDFRFFAFNQCIVVPLLFLFALKKGGRKDES